MENLLLYHTSKIDTNIILPKKITVGNVNNVFISTYGKQIHIVDFGSVFKSLRFEENVVNFEYLHQEHALFVALDNGLIIMQSLKENEKPEEISYCQDGIIGMKFSPDQEIVVFITK